MTTYLFNSPTNTRARGPRRTAIGSAIVLLSALFFPSLAQAQQGIHWSFAPYVWGANVATRADINEHDTIDHTVRFTEKVDDTDFAIMGIVEARGEHWGAFIDGAYLNLGDQRAALQVNPQVGPAPPSQVNIDLKYNLVDGVVFYRPGGGPEGLDVYGGIRYFDLDNKIDVSFPTNPPSSARLQIDQKIVNAIAGLRYSAAITDRWHFGGRADAGAGDAKLTWNVQATAGYLIGAEKKWSVEFGYRYNELKFENDDQDLADIDSKIETRGPIVGFAFRF